MKKVVLKKTGWGILISLGISIGVTFLMLIGGFRNWELKTLDLRFKFRGPQDVSHSDLIIIAIDRQTFKACQDRYPYPRDYYATLIDNLNEVGIKRIMFDIQFTEPDMKNIKGDSLLAASIVRAGNVILAGTIARETSTGGVYVYSDKPIPVLLATGAEWGVVGEMQDSDGFTRRYSIFEYYQDNMKYTLGTKVFFEENNIPPSPVFDTEKNFSEGNFIFKDTLSGGIHKIQAHRGALGFEQTFLINYYGPAKTFPTYSLSSLLDDADFDLKIDEDTDYLEIFKKNSIYPYEFRLAFISDSVKQAEGYIALAMGDTTKMDNIIQSENPFKDKIALIGVSLLELHDNKYTPFFNFKGSQTLMPGVETHAHAIQTMLDEKYISKTPFAIDFILIVLLGILTSVFVFFLRPVFGGLIAIIFSILVALGSYWVFIKYSAWLYLTPIIINVISSYVGNVIYQFLSEQKEKKKIRGMFQTYMSPKVLKYLEDHPDAFSLSGEKREATMFFSDVQGFTTISESLSAEELSEVLNKYLSPMTDICMKYDGYVDKYEGDAIMCDFGVPMIDNDHALKACYATLDQQEKLLTLREEIKRDHNVDIIVRMGVNSGVVSAGNMGSSHRFQYTVMGDAVNQASRFEGANKQYGTFKMIGESTYALVKDHVEVRILDRLVVKGKLVPITVYELICRKGEITKEQAQIRDLFTEAIETYWDRKWDEAIKKFEQAIAVTGEDPPSTVFISRCKAFKENPPAENWQGEFVMTTK